MPECHSNGKCQDWYVCSTYPNKEDCPYKTGKINKGHFHEIMDRSHVICSMIDEFLIEHPGMTKQMNDLCREVQSKLCLVMSMADEEERIFNKEKE